MRIRIRTDPPHQDPTVRASRRRRYQSAFRQISENILDKFVCEKKLEPSSEASGAAAAEFLLNGILRAPRPPVPAREGEDQQEQDEDKPLSPGTLKFWSQLALQAVLDQVAGGDWLPVRRARCEEFLRLSARFEHSAQHGGPFLLRELYACLCPQAVVIEEFNFLLAHLFREVMHGNGASGQNEVLELKVLKKLSEAGVGYFLSAKLDDEFASVLGTADAEARADEFFVYRQPRLTKMLKQALAAEREPSARSPSGAGSGSGVTSKMVTDLLAKASLFQRHRAESRLVKMRKWTRSHVLQFATDAGLGLEVLSFVHRDAVDGVILTTLEGVDFAHINPSQERLFFAFRDGDSEQCRKLVADLELQKSTADEERAVSPLKGAEAASELAHSASEKLLGGLQLQQTNNFVSTEDVAGAAAVDEDGEALSDDREAVTNANAAELASAVSSTTAAGDASSSGNEQVQLRQEQETKDIKLLNRTRAAATSKSKASNLVVKKVSTIPVTAAPPSLMPQVPVDVAELAAAANAYLNRSKEAEIKKESPSASPQDRGTGCAKKKPVRSPHPQRFSPRLIMNRHQTSQKWGFELVEALTGDTVAFCTKDQVLTLISSEGANLSAEELSPIRREKLASNKWLADVSSANWEAALAEKTALIEFLIEELELAKCNKKPSTSGVEEQAQGAPLHEIASMQREFLDDLKREDVVAVADGGDIKDPLQLESPLVVAAEREPESWRAPLLVGGTIDSQRVTSAAGAATSGRNVERVVLGGNNAKEKDHDRVESAGKSGRQEFVQAAPASSPLERSKEQPPAVATRVVPSSFSTANNSSVRATSADNRPGIHLGSRFHPPTTSQLFAPATRRAAGAAPPPLNKLTKSPAPTTRLLKHRPAAFQVASPRISNMKHVLSPRLNEGREVRESSIKPIASERDAAASRESSVSVDVPGPSSCSAARTPDALSRTRNDRGGGGVLAVGGSATSTSSRAGAAGPRPQVMKGFRIQSPRLLGATASAGSANAFVTTKLVGQNPKLASGSVAGGSSNVGLPSGAKPTSATSLDEVSRSVPTQVPAQARRPLLELREGVSSGSIPPSGAASVAGGVGARRPPTGLVRGPGASSKGSAKSSGGNQSPGLGASPEDLGGSGLPAAAAPPPSTTSSALTSTSKARGGRFADPVDRPSRTRDRDTVETSATNRPSKAPEKTVNKKVAVSSSKSAEEPLPVLETERTAPATTEQRRSRHQEKISPTSKNMSSSSRRSASFSSIKSSSLVIRSASGAAPTAAGAPSQIDGASTLAGAAGGSAAPNKRLVPNFMAGGGSSAVGIAPGEAGGVNVEALSGPRLPLPQVAANIKQRWATKSPDGRLLQFQAKFVSPRISPRGSAGISGGAAAGPRPGGVFTTISAASPRGMRMKLNAVPAKISPKDEGNPILECKKGGREEDGAGGAVGNVAAAGSPAAASSIEGKNKKNIDGLSRSGRAAEAAHKL
eukprot:CAMPEP_0179007900 /NCGR_PEP_ID=MMETSP0795-20121207/15413_1 /TAXON_ID=88552 /ORGANISM="Amoebophrya sp., Strain Ameob2" /LENGTH=1472 /DNA_ID=CAMNT_0020702917 /DNA_START=396 /DNA_END=4814 /DNA_ORIENTATION=-